MSIRHVPSVTDITLLVNGRAESQVHTIKKPREYATGIIHVLVNGRLAMRDGARTEDGGGEVLRP